MYKKKEIITYQGTFFEPCIQEMWKKLVQKYRLRLLFDQIEEKKNVKEFLLKFIPEHFLVDFKGTKAVLTIQGILNDQKIELKQYVYFLENDKMEFDFWNIKFFNKKSQYLYCYFSEYIPTDELEELINSVRDSLNQLLIMDHFQNAKRSDTVFVKDEENFDTSQSQIEQNRLFHKRNRKKSFKHIKNM